ncbi:MAG: ornithine cyclodeaminase [Proteobacteria bacterium]|nr:ornithine cyclodeaminase [Pseudomonadota bacterium]
MRDALVAQADGRVQSPLPGQLQFRSPPGDCHIKYGHVAGSPNFVIKIATGFYENPSRGLAASDGLVVVFDAATGTPRVLFQDEGWLTAWRTAAATAVAAQALAPVKITAIGVVGTGLQAELALEWLPLLLGERPAYVWGRSLPKARALAARASGAARPVAALEDIGELLARCNVVVTATPSAQPLFAADAVRAGTHLVAIGADSPGKQELPEALFARAGQVVVDDLAQCLDHGDTGLAVRAGVLDASRVVPLGRLLAAPGRPARAEAEVTIADLTGIAAEDIAIAGLFQERLCA